MEYGRRPHILLVKMGKYGHDCGSRFIAFGLSGLGFDVDLGPLFFTPGRVADLAADFNVHVIGVSSQAAGHLSLFPELRDDLRMRSRRSRMGGRGQGGHRRRLKGRVVLQYGGCGGEGHTNPGSRFSTGKRGKRRRRREQVLRRYIRSRYLHYLRRRRSSVYHSIQEGRGETMICI